MCINCILANTGCLLAGLISAANARIRFPHRSNQQIDDLPINTLDGNCMSVTLIQFTIQTNKPKRLLRGSSHRNFLICLFKYDYSCKQIYFIYYKSANRIQIDA